MLESSQERIQIWMYLMTVINFRSTYYKNTKNFSRETLDMLITESTLSEDDVECLDEDMDEESDGESSMDEEWTASPELL